LPTVAETVVLKKFLKKDIDPLAEAGQGRPPHLKITIGDGRVKVSYVDDRYLRGKYYETDYDEMEQRQNGVLADIPRAQLRPTGLFIVLRDSAQNQRP
jgi:hypothetical protein